MNGIKARTTSQKLILRQSVKGLTAQSNLARKTTLTARNKSQVSNSNGENSKWNVVSKASAG